MGVIDRDLRCCISMIILVVVMVVVMYVEDDGTHDGNG